MNSQIQQEANSEFIHFHKAFFSFAPPAKIIERYEDYRSRTESNHLKQEETVRRIIQRQLDPEAIEFVFRLRAKNHLLTHRIQAFSFFCESHPLYWNCYYSARSERVSSYLKILGHGLRAFWLLPKGLFLIWRHNLD